MKPKVLVLSGYGINCERETKFAFEHVGAEAEIIHINDLINKDKNLKDFQILAIPGGFSYGDDTGSGNALANKIKLNLWEELKSFIDSGKLVHRWKAEKKLGRRLQPGEVVHHQNKIKTDNRYGNLQVFNSRKTHQAHHIKKAWERTRRKRTLKGK